MIVFPLTKREQATNRWLGWLMGLSGLAIIAVLLSVSWTLA